MKAALLVKPKTPLEVKDVEIPKVNKNEVLVKVKACGICHSDLHFIYGDRPTGKLPIILGHEAAGIVEEVGEEVTDFSKGDRVAINYYFTCGKCPYCRAGLENLCEHIIRFGMDVDGAYAEYTKVPARSLAKIDPEVSFEEAAVATDAVATPYHALKDSGNLRINDTVAIYGIGGLGINAVQIAHISGARVIAIDIVDEKLDLAKQLGADETINAKNEDPVEKIMTLTNNKGVDLAVEFIGLPKTIVQAINSVKRSGRAVLVGFSPRDIQVNPTELILKEVSIKGSRGLLHRTLIEVLTLVKEKKINLKPVITNIFSIDEINEGISQLREGKTIRSIVKF
ncbi:MAG: alcohol dehydrogenase catalytic domain-containing protein [Candidatus Odinarchaeia archaeon]